MNLWQRWVQRLTGGAELKAISHRPDLAGREHIYTAYADAIAPDMSDFVGYATVYGSYVWVAKAINLVANNVIGLPVRVVDTDDQPLDGHPVSYLLAHINDEETPADLWGAYIVHKLLAGEAFFELVPDGRGRPAELWLRRPDLMLVQPDATRLDYPAAAGYIYLSETGNRVELAPEQVIHDKFYNPLLPWRGLPPIAAVREGITIDLFSQAWSKSFIKNNARPDFALVAPQGITPSERDRYLSEFLRKHQGAGNAHLPVILEDGITDLKTFSFAPKDLEWLEQRKFSRDEVGAIFGVPDELMGYGKDTYENFQTALEVFWTLTLRPILLRRDLVLTNHFRKAGLLRPGERVDTDLSDVGALQEDMTPKVEMAVKLWQAGVPWNILDERFGLGIGAIPGGDVAYVPSSMTPVELLALNLEQARNPQPAPAQAPPPADEPEQDEDTGDTDEGEEREAEMRRLRVWARKRKHPDPAKFRSSILSESEKHAVLAELEAATARDFFTGTLPALTLPDVNQLTLPDGPLTPEIIRALTLQLDPDDDEAEQKVRAALEKRSEKQIAQALGGVLSDAMPDAEGDVPTLPDAIDREMRQGRRVRDALERMLIDGADLGVSASVAQLEGVGFGFDFTLANTAARDWAGRYTGELITQVSDTTRRGVQQAVSRWVENGEPLQALIDDLTPLFGERRAALIASTEVTRAYAQANAIAYRESGVVDRVEWRTANDERVCPQCGPLHTKRAPLDTLAFDGYTGAPPRHPACRCWIVPVISEPGDEDD